MTVLHGRECLLCVHFVDLAPISGSVALMSLHGCTRGSDSYFEERWDISYIGMNMCEVVIYFLDD